MRNSDIDQLRGYAFLLMVVQHLFYFRDVRNDYKTNYASIPFIKASGTISRHIFILLVGTSIYMNYAKHQKRKKEFIRKRFQRSMEILMHATIISILTYNLYPKYWVRFGVLHFIALASLLVSILLAISPVTLIVVVCLLIPSIQKHTWNSDNTIIDTILGTRIHYRMMDYFPLLSWLPLLVIGIGFGYLMQHTRSVIPVNDLITWLSNHSLDLYTYHVIVLLGIYKFV